MKALYWAFPAPFLIVHGHLEARSTWKYDDHFNSKNYMTHGRHFEDINNQEKISFRATNPVDFQKSPSSDFIWCERRDLSRSAASRPKKALSARQEVDLYQVYKSSCSKLYGKEARYNETSL